MSTRGLVTLINKKGKKKVSTFLPYDAGPKYAGERFIAQYFRYKHLLDEKLANVKFVSFDDVEKKAFSIIGKTKIDSSDEEILREKLPAFILSEGFNIIENIAEGKVTETIDESDFSNDSVFCEWSYTIDEQKQKVIVKKGFSGEIHEFPLKQETIFKNFLYLED